jgi:hypothetical protein
VLWLALALSKAFAVTLTVGLTLVVGVGWHLRHPIDEHGQKVNPEKVGEYRVVAGMRIDPEKAAGAHIFRPWGWTMALVVSEYLKQALEREGITGTRSTEA